METFRGGCLPINNNLESFMATLELGATGSLMLLEQLPVIPNRGTRDHVGKGGRGDSLRSICNCAEIVMRAAINGMIQPSAWTSAVALAGVKPRTPGGGKVQPVEQSA